MRPSAWQPPIPLSAAETAIVRRIRRAKLFVFLRTIRHDLFDDAFQMELAQIFRASARGQPPVPPAQLALATILQAYTGVSDDEVIEALVMDRRWQLVLDCLDCDHAPFGKATLIRFRTALIVHGLDRRLVERTVELAERDGGFGPRPLRVALDSSPLWGAGRVEDTLNLLGHALKKALGVIARQQGRGLTTVATEAGTPILAASSLKAALDLDWDDPTARDTALATVLASVDALTTWLATAPPGGALPTVTASMAVAQQVRAQDVDEPADGPARVRQGVAKDRRISVEDGQMRHGRKSRAVRFDGYKRHVCRDLDSLLVRAVGLTAANQPEATVTDAIVADLLAQAAIPAEWHLDRAYLSSTLVRERADDLAIYCRAWRVQNGSRYAKTAFVLDWEAATIRCPNGAVRPLTLGAVVHFPAATCAACPPRAHCTTSPDGRSVSIHPDEQLLAELRTRQQTPEGRAALRQRVAVEHCLAHIGHWQGDRARYRGLRKNLFDLRRVAVVHNLHVLARYPATTDQEAA
ncbi:MAG: IS1182 family transposase [Chloroflexi bacterium]|nr:IS1182 family transposase [Chloroflexota bacterium]